MVSLPCAERLFPHSPLKSSDPPHNPQFVHSSMGFIKKLTASSSYPARRNRIDQQQHTTTVLPSNYGAHDPNPIPAIPTHTAAARPVVAATATTTSVQPVTATAYSGTTAHATQAQTAPVVATAYVPGSSPQNPVQAAVYNPNGQTSPSVPSPQVPVQAAVYNPNAQAASGPTMHDSTPSYNPSYNANQPKRPSFNNGNCSYKTNESVSWCCLCLLLTGAR